MGGHRLHVRLPEAVQVLVSGLRGTEDTPLSHANVCGGVVFQVRSGSDLRPPLAQGDAGVGQSGVVPGTGAEPNGSGLTLVQETRRRRQDVHLLRLDRRHPRAEHPGVPVHLVQDVHLEEHTLHTSGISSVHKVNLESPGESLAWSLQVSPSPCP